MTPAAHRLHPARRRRRADRRGRQGLLRRGRPRCRAGARSVVVERARQAQYRPVRRRASDRAGRDRVQPRARPRQGADHRAVRARRERQRHHGVAGAPRRAREQPPTATSLDPMVSARGAGARGGGAQGARPRPAHLRHDVPVLDAQLSPALLDGGGRRRSGRGRAPGRAAAALHGGEPANRHVDGFCVGAPWNSVAVDLGIGLILHFVSEILPRAAEKVLAVRAALGARRIPTCWRALVRAHAARRGFRRGRRATATRSRRILAGAEPHRRRAGGDPPHARRPAEGLARRRHAHRRALSAGRPRRRGAPRPGAGGMALCADGALGPGAAVGRPARRRRRRCSGPTFTTLRSAMPRMPADAGDGIGAFAGPPFDPTDIAGISRPGGSNACRLIRDPAVCLDFVHCTKFNMLRPGRAASALSSDSPQFRHLSPSY